MSDLVIRNVGIQEGIGQATREPMDVYIKEGLISGILPVSKKAHADTLVDGTGKTLMPGMVFAHTHIAYDSVCGPRDVLFKHPLPKLTLIAAAVAKTAAELGYTTMVGAGSVCQIDVFLKKAIDDGLFIGPNFIPCSRDIMCAGPIGRRNKEKVSHIPSDYMPIITDEEEIDKATHKEIDDGAEIIKTFATGDDQFPNASADEELFSLQELKQIVSIAKQRNVLVRCHARGLKGIKNAIAAGVDIIDHASYADQESLENILKQAITIVPSYYQPKRYIEEGEKFGKHPEESNFSLEIKNTMHFLPIAEKMGINIAVGDDFGFAWTPHGSYHEELIAYQQDLHIPPPIIIKWATSNVAKMIKKDHCLGRIKQGYQADLILLNKDPANDITVIKDQRHSIFIKGRCINHEK